MAGVFEHGVFEQDPLDEWLCNVSARCHLTDATYNVTTNDGTSEVYNNLSVDHDMVLANTRGDPISRISLVIARKTWKCTEEEIGSPDGKTLARIDTMHGKYSDFLSLIACDGLDAWRGNLQQIECAGRLGGMNLYQLYSLASGLGLAKSLGWSSINVPYTSVKQFRDLVLDQHGAVKPEWRGSLKQIECAGRLGGMNLYQLYSLASGLGLAKSLGWSSINVPYASVKQFRDLVMDQHGAVKPEWRGNLKQIECAGRLGGMHLRQLHSLASGLGLAKNLGWPHVSVPYTSAIWFQHTIGSCISKGRHDTICGYGGRLSFCLHQGFNVTASLLLAEAFDFESVLDWRVRSKTPRGALILDATRNGRTLHERIDEGGEDETLELVQAKRLLELLICLKRGDESALPRLADILDLDDLRARELAGRVATLTEAELREIFE